MRLVSLSNQPVVDRTSWTLVALGIGTAVIKVWDTIRLGLSPALALLITLFAAFGLIAYRHARYRAGLCPAQQRVYRFLMLYGWVLRRSEIDVSDARSVNAELAGRTRTQLAVLVATRDGFVELIRIPSKKGSGVAEAETICARVARHLGIPSYGVNTEEH